MDYYEILGVGPEATAQDIKKAFRQIARECHPDVTKDDPVAAERFKAARKAYETLIDPVTRSRYDRRGERRQFDKGSFFESFYRSTGERSEGKSGARPRGGPTHGVHDAGGNPGAGRRAKNNPANDLDLEDLFSGFGDFGFANGGGNAGSSSRPSSEGPRVSPGAPLAGLDVEIDLEVPAEVAREGGTVTAVYHRLQRADHWRPGSPDPGVVRIQDIADVRVVPGTRDGEILHERGLGDAGIHGGPYGDLLVRLRVVQPRRAAPPPRAQQARTPTEAPPRQEAPPPRQDPPPRREAPTPSDAVEWPLDISLVEALLGGRVEITTPAGKVRLTIPPGTSSGKKMRLKGKGTEGSDLYVVTRIMVPESIDDESRRLIEEYARLNPGSPRDP